MDSRYSRAIEKESAEALLDRGVSVPLFSFKFPFFRRRAVRMMMRRPTLAGLIRIARLYNTLGVTADELERLDKDGQMRFLERHGVTVARMVAVTLCRGWVAERLLERPLTWVIRRKMPAELMTGAMTRFVMLLGTDPFTSIIRLAGGMNPLRPRLSQERRGS